MLIAFGRGGARRSDVASVVGKRCVEKLTGTLRTIEKDVVFFFFSRTDECTGNNDKQQLKIG